MKYCKQCEKQITPIKKRFSWLALWFTFGWYALYRVLFVRCNRCPICRIKI